MMQGCMGWDEVGQVTKIDGRMDVDLYMVILEDELQQTLKFYGKSVDDIICQQDNDPKVTSKKAQRWFKDHKFTVPKLPAQSPDLSPIEQLWNHLKRRLEEFEEPASSVSELWDIVQKLWEEIPREEHQKLIESMYRRPETMIKAKGGYSKY